MTLLQEPKSSTGRVGRVGIFGGSFDPPHNAHVALAQVALTQLQLDTVLWIPTGHAWQKRSPFASADQRAEMVALAIADQPRFVLDRREQMRSGPSYTLDTVRELQTEHAGAAIVLIIGQDQYAGFHTWRGWQELLQSVTLAVAARPGAPLQVNDDVTRTAEKQTVTLPLMDISSTEIRSRLANGLAVADLVPAAVASYIARQGLYTSSNSSKPGPHTQELNGHS